MAVKFVEKGMVIDTSKCQACKACQVACQQWHSLEAEDTSFTGSYQNPPDMSGANLTIVKFIEVGNNGDLRWLFFIDRCRHCERPTCKTACPLVPKAIKRQKNGIVRIDPDLCNPDLCSNSEVKPCQQACPFKTDGNPLSPIGIPKKDYVKFKDDLVTTKMRKCDFCYDRFGASGAGLPVGAFANSKQPACALTCPPGAIKVYSVKTYTRGKIITKIRNKAQERVDELKASGYPNANVYPSGLQTHVVWVLLEPPSVYGIVPA